MSADKQLFIAMYIDDLLIMGLNFSRQENVQQKLRDRLKMTNLGNVFYYLRMQIVYVIGKKITLCQSAYLK